jgi:hypothetical protein
LRRLDPTGRLSRVPLISLKRLLLLLAAALAVSLAGGPARASTLPETELAAGEVIEEVLVTGQQPGPGLWKVTRPGDPRGHVLWVLGNHSPLPRKFAWKSAEVEAVIRASQEVLAPPSVNASVGPLGGITLLPALIGARKNPDDQRLQQLLPADLYARWLPLKLRYLGDTDGVERWRPIFAASELYRAALEDRGLVPYEGVWPAVERVARKARVRVIKPEVALKIDKPRAAIREFKSISLDDTECFARTLRRLESDLDLMRDRANAWAVGDVRRLRELAPVERASACIGVVLESSFAQQRGYGDVLDRVRTAWLVAAEDALQRNASTLAVVSVDEWLKPDGHFARLRQRGYEVEDP